MIRFLIHTLISLGSAALGLLLASWVVQGFTLSISGFIIAVVVFTVAQAVLAPFIFNIARKYASPILGGIGLVSTFAALLIASLFPGGIRISGVVGWILSTLVVWIVTALGTWILGAVFLKRVVTERRSA